MKILVTGFEPFGGDPINPSAEIARNLPRSIEGIRVATAVLPVVYYASLAMLQRMIATCRPDAVICMGLAGGRWCLSFETRAVNKNAARIPDNIGQRPDGEEIHWHGPGALPPTLPLKAISRGLRRAGIPVELLPVSGNVSLQSRLLWTCGLHTRGGPFPVRRVHPRSLPHGTVRFDPGAPVQTLDQLVRGVRETIAVLAR